MVYWVACAAPAVAPDAAGRRDSGVRLGLEWPAYPRRTQFLARLLGLLRPERLDISPACGTRILSRETDVVRREDPSLGPDQERLQRVAAAFQVHHRRFCSPPGGSSLASSSPLTSRGGTLVGVIVEDRVLEAAGSQLLAISSRVWMNRVSFFCVTLYSGGRAT